MTQSGQWTRPEGPAPEVLVDTVAAAHAIGVNPRRIRNWALRGHLQRRGKDKRGRTLYALRDVRTVFRDQSGKQSPER